MNIEVNCELQTRITWSLECGGITFVPSAVRARCTKYTVRAAHERRYSRKQRETTGRDSVCSIRISSGLSHLCGVGDVLKFTVFIITDLYRVPSKTPKFFQT